MHAEAALVACVLFVAVGLFQLALVLGAPWGRLAWGGQHHGVLPTNLRVGSAVALVLYVLFAMVLLDRGGVYDVLPDAVSVVGAWLLFAYLAVGVVMNGLSRSRPERLVMTPVALVLALCSLVVALR